MVLTNARGRFFLKHKRVKLSVTFEIFTVKLDRASVDFDIVSELLTLK